jgi:hypothetical protein
MEPQSPAPAPPWDPELAQYLAELQSFTPPDCLRPDTIIEVFSCAHSPRSSVAHHRQLYV